MYKLIAFDLDGTLAESKCAITTEMAELLSCLSEKARVVVISGGAFSQFNKQLLVSLKPNPNIICMPTDGSEQFDYVIESNDKDESKWKSVDQVIFPEELKKKSIEVFNKIISSGKFDIPANPKGEYVEDRGTQVTFSALGQNRDLEEKKNWDPDQKKRQKIKLELERLLPDVSIGIAGTTSIDILQKGFNKGVGLSRLLEKLGLKKEETLFVGDAVFPGGNDYSAYEAGLPSVKVAGPDETMKLIHKILMNETIYPLQKVDKNPIAFFCSEYALTDDSSMYAGGLGVLAGDYLLEIADQNIPFVAIGLKYGASHPALFNILENVTIEIPIVGDTIKAKVWHQQLAENTHIYLLDTDTTENSAEDKTITFGLYDGDFYKRLKQQMVLGIGGVRLLSFLEITPSVYHLNEGHVACAAIALLVEKKTDASKIVATKHTILSDAGMRLGLPDFINYFEPYCQKFGMDVHEIFEKGKTNEENFSTTKFLMTVAHKKNAVSKIHAVFEKKKHPESELIGITNGVYQKRWQAKELYHPPTDLSKIISDEELWNIKRKLRRNLFNHIEEETGIALNPKICTVIWARRFASYKRPYLLFSDIERLISILTNQERPMQIVLSGKAHPSDKVGMGIVKKIQAFWENPKVKGKIVYLPHYSISLAAELVQGADIWLNTPELGKEACGTSGMKAGLNGSLECSVRDGWVDEVSWSGRGWILPEENDVRTTASVLYDLLEHEILPMFYASGEDTIPKEWVTRMRSTIEIVEKNYTTKRMVREYMDQLYGLKEE